MGWTSFNANGRTANEILTAEFTQTANRADGSIQTQWDVIDTSTRGREWYAVIRTTNGGDGFTRYFAMVCLWSIKNGEFSYKDMGDECEPYYYNAPRRLLDLLDKFAPNPTGGAKTWREKCREKLSQKPRFKPVKGLQIIHGARVYTLCEPAGARRGWYAVRGDGEIFRFPISALSRSIPA